MTRRDKLRWCQEQWRQEVRLAGTIIFRRRELNKMERLEANMPRTSNRYPKWMAWTIIADSKWIKSAQSPLVLSRPRPRLRPTKRRRRIKMNASTKVPPNSMTLKTESRDQSRRQMKITRQYHLNLKRNLRSRWRNLLSRFSRSESKPGRKNKWRICLFQTNLTSEILRMYLNSLIRSTKTWETRRNSFRLIQTTFKKSKQKLRTLREHF